MINSLLNKLTEKFPEVTLLFIAVTLYVFNFVHWPDLVILKMILTLLFCLFALLCLALQFKEIQPLGRAFFVAIGVVSGVVYFISRRFELVTDFLLIASLVRVLEFPMIYSRGFLRKVSFFLLTGLTVNLLLHHDEPRLSVGGLDPNYSAYLFFLLFLFCYKAFEAQKWTYVILALGFFTYSRAFFISLIFWLLYQSMGPLKKMRPGLIVALPLLLIGLFTFWITFNVDQTLVFRLIDKIADIAFQVFGDAAHVIHFTKSQSDSMRHLANMNFFNYLQSSSQGFWYGTDLLIYERELKLIPPHNFYLLALLKSGVVLGGIVLSYLLFRFFQRCNDNRAILFSLSPFFAFLGVEVAAIYTLFLALIIQLKIKDVV